METVTRRRLPAKRWASLRGIVRPRTLPARSPLPLTDVMRGCLRSGPSSAHGRRLSGANESPYGVPAHITMPGAPAHTKWLPHRLDDVAVRHPFASATQVTTALSGPQLAPAIAQFGSLTHSSPAIASPGPIGVAESSCAAFASADANAESPEAASDSAGMASSGAAASAGALADELA